MQRELTEEVEIGSPYRERCLGFIYDPSTPVGEVHLGVAHVFDLDERLARACAKRPSPRPGCADRRLASRARSV